MDNFHFRGFTPSGPLRNKAEKALDRIIDRSPSDAKVTACLELVEDRFHCSIEVGSISCPISVEVSHKFAMIAVDKAELAVMRKLGQWKSTRFLNIDSSPLRVPLRATIAGLTNKEA